MGRVTLKQAKRYERLPRERLVQGKNHAEKNALLAGYLIPLLRSQQPCNKEKQFPTMLENAWVVFKKER